MSDTYAINFLNNSSDPGTFAVFQKDPNLGVSDVFSLAWFAKYTYPSASDTFQWEISYNFVWQETGELTPGVIFNATQAPEADLGTSGQITLTYDSRNQAYNFIDQGPGATAASLYIKEDRSVPLKQAAVGIGMSNSGTFVVQAEPNKSLVFTPHPSYWIVFGQFSAGQVLDVESITGAAEVLFPPGVFTMQATLNPDNTWSITTAAKANSALAEARRHFPMQFAQPSTAARR